MPDIDLVTPPAAATEFRRYQCGAVVKMPAEAYLEIFAPDVAPDSFQAFLCDCFASDSETFLVPERLRPEIPLWFGCSTKRFGFWNEDPPELEPFVRVELSRGMDIRFVAFALEWRAPEAKSWRQRPSLLNA